MVDFVHARALMVETQLRTRNVSDRRVLSAMGRIERERFVPVFRKELAYIDDVQPLTQDVPPRLMSSPAPLARLLQLADIQPGDVVLDVGAATGYSTAILSQLARAVVALEVDPGLAQVARGNISALSIGNVTVVEGKLDVPPAGHGPFDAIVLEGMVDAVPPQLFRALRDGGRLVALLHQNGTGVAHLFIRSGAEVAKRAEFDASMPPLPLPARAQEFVF